MTTSTPRCLISRNVPSSVYEGLPDVAAVSGTPTLIFNECWGVNVLSNGDYLLACGTGIENCDGNRATQDCQDGRGDLRAGAYTRGAGIWQSMTIRTNSAGVLQWQRVDAYKAPEGPPIGTGAFNQVSSVMFALELHR